jgi:hypothetical protein
MTKLPWVALVCGGPVSRSGVARIPRLDQHLGWVKASTIAAASRAVHVLNAGRPVRAAEDLSEAELILIQAPTAAVSSIVHSLASSDVDWRSKSVALVHAVLDCSALQPLERRGACIASLALISDPPPRFLIEGQPQAAQRLRRFLKRTGADFIEIQYRRKDEYLAGVRAATIEFVPLFARAVEQLRESGMEKAAAQSIAASLVESSVRAYFRGGKRTVDRAAQLTPPA